MAGRASLTGLLKAFRLEQQRSTSTDPVRKVSVPIPSPPGRMPLPEPLVSPLPKPPPSSPPQEVAPAPTQASTLEGTSAPAELPLAANETRSSTSLATTAPSSALDHEGHRAQWVHNQQMNEIEMLIGTLRAISKTAPAADLGGVTHVHEEDALHAALVPVPNNRGPMATEATETDLGHRQVWQSVLKIDEGHDVQARKDDTPRGNRGIRRTVKEKKDQKKGWMGTTRRNTLIGVDYGIGSGRVASSHLSRMTMESGLVPAEPPHAAIRRNLDALDTAKRNALRDLRRRKRAGIAVARSMIGECEERAGWHNFISSFILHTGVSIRFLSARQPSNVLIQYLKMRKQLVYVNSSVSRTQRKVLDLVRVWQYLLWSQGASCIRPQFLSSRCTMLGDLRH